MSSREYDFPRYLNSSSMFETITDVELERTQKMIFIDKIYFFARSPEGHELRTERDKGELEDPFNKLATNIKVSEFVGDSNDNRNIEAGINLMYQPRAHMVRNDSTNWTRVIAGIYENEGSLYFKAYMYSCKNKDCSEEYDIADFTGDLENDTIIDANVEYELSIEFIEADQEFAITLDGVTGYFDLSALPHITKENFYQGGLRIYAGSNWDPGSSASMTVVYDDIKIDDELYEDFSSNKIISTKWRDDSDENRMPILTAISISNIDTDTDSGELAGDISIVKASSEISITHYNLYWGARPDSKLSPTSIATLAKTGEDLVYTFSDNTVIPDGAKYLLVYTSNDEGEMETGVSTGISDEDGIERKLPDTGQITSYTSTFGEDHDYLINPLSYTDNSDETVTDNNTNLMWQQEDDNVTRTWEDAGTYCTNLSLGGYYDWRLPNPKELLSIVSFENYNPAIDTVFFNSTKSSIYWSSASSSAGDDDYVWHLNFYWGEVEDNSNSNEYYARCVRGSSRLAIWTFDFTNIGNGTINHGSTNLMWQQEDDYVARSWEDSLVYCDGLSLGGYSDWRLPNIKELQTIIDYNLSYPATDDTYFFVSENSLFYWSSTAFANGDYSWAVHFGGGEVFNLSKSEDYYVRCVRGGPPNSVPFLTATSVSFTDTDSDSGKLGGTITIGKANDESAITHYVLYWGSNESTKQSPTALANIEKTGDNPTWAFPDNTLVPNDATHLLIFTKNDNGEMETGVSTPIFDDDGIERNLPDTGQSSSYTGTFGEDADYLINPLSFTDNGDGTVTDNNTKQMWQQADDNTLRTWENAGTYCTNLSLGGYYDWRLPSSKELQTIVKHGSITPAIDTNYFLNTNSSDYWSSTIKAGDTNYAWYVNFSYGDVYSYIKSGSYGVRCVRGGSELAIWAFDYSNLGNGTVSHGSTSLMWQQEDDNVPRTWEEALDYCENISLGGHTDWRLSNVKELLTIVDNATNSPTIDTTYFPNTESNVYWSSTTGAEVTSYAWYVNFDNGEVDYYYKSHSHYVRCVRGGRQAAISVSFNDTDSDIGELSGDVTIVKAGDESDVIQYKLYWGSNSTTKYDPTPITTLAKTGGNLVYTFEDNTPIPDGATHLLVFTNNNEGEMLTGVSTIIFDEERNLPDTGQTTSYTATMGEDADYLIHAPSYNNNGNGTVTDNNTVLMWQQEDDNITRTWEEAGAYCTNLSLGGYNDWRLPNAKELQSVVLYGALYPSIDTDVFLNTNTSPYWSSTTSAANLDSALSVGFFAGGAHSYGKNDYNYVRCVRGGHESMIWPLDFLDQGNGIVSHGSTELMWQQQDDNTTKTWENSLLYCQNLSLGGYTDWRLPNIKELLTIISFERYYPAIDLEYFPNTDSSSYYWSSTTSLGDIQAAWSVFFGDVYVGNPRKSDYKNVRCVRGGNESGDTTSPTSTSISINSGANSTSSINATLTLAASDNVGIIAYYASETSTTPASSDSGWTSVTSTTSYSANVSFVLSSGDGTKIVYIWFKDSAGNASAVASDTIILNSDTDLLVYWNFDEGTGSTVNDLSGNGHHGVVYGATWVSGSQGNALSFDGVDDYASFPNDITFLEDFTLNFKIKFPDSDRPSYVLEKHRTHDNTDGGWLINMNSGFSFSNTPAGTGDYREISIPYTYQTNVWHEIVMTFNDTDNNYKVYVDGTEIGNGTLDIEMKVNSHPFYIGAAYSGSPDGYFKFIIDELKIYERVISVN